MRTAQARYHEPVWYTLTNTPTPAPSYPQSQCLSPFLTPPTPQLTSRSRTSAIVGTAADNHTHRGDQRSSRLLTSRRISLASLTSQTPDHRLKSTTETSHDTSSDWRQSAARNPTSTSTGRPESSGISEGRVIRWIISTCHRASDVSKLLKVRGRGTATRHDAEGHPTATSTPRTDPGRRARAPSTHSQVPLSPYIATPRVSTP